jgi:hypothetical protein
LINYKPDGFNQDRLVCIDSQGAFNNLEGAEAEEFHRSNAKCLPDGYVQ